jgi:hypothetical protein
MSTKLTTNIWPTRSGKADYRELHKLQDVTRYNTSTYNVAFYKDSPNRQGTPKPIARRNQSTKPQKSRSPKKMYLESIIKEAPFVEKIYQNALKFKPRNLTAQFPIVQHPYKINTAVYNDFHIRETNAGFARNSYGGFYTK